MRLPLQYYASHHSGEIISRLEDIQEIKQLVSQIVISLLFVIKKKSIITLPSFEKCYNLFFTIMTLI